MGGTLNGQRLKHVYLAVMKMVLDIMRTHVPMVVEVRDIGCINQHLHKYVQDKELTLLSVVSTGLRFFAAGVCDGL
jgi:uncharacterized protein YllA (UPF0747 family)